MLAAHEHVSLYRAVKLTCCTLGGYRMQVCDATRWRFSYVRWRQYCVIGIGTTAGARKDVEWDWH